MESTPWGPVDLKAPVVMVPKVDAWSAKDEMWIWWRATVLVRCKGWGHPCANSALIRHGGTRCSVCTRKAADASVYAYESVEAIADLWGEFRRAEQPRHCYPSLAPDDNAIFEEGGESFSGTDAVDAAMEVARVLAANGERGFEVLYEEEISGRRNFYDILLKAIKRLAYIADTKKLPWKTTKAASVLGGVRPRPPIIPSKAGRPNIGHVLDYSEASFLHRLFAEKGINHPKIGSYEARDQIGVLMSTQYDDNDVATVCNAALAAANVAHLKETDPELFESGRLKWHHFQGGNWAEGNFPTCQ